MDYLGSRLTDIAREKAGIIKPEVPVVCGTTQTEVRNCIDDYARKCRSPIYFMGRDFNPENWRVMVQNDKKKQLNEIRWGQRSLCLKTQLLGHHQCANTAIVYAVLQLLKKQDRRFSIKRGITGIERALWPGRMHIMPNGILVDAAHNPAGVSATIASLKHVYPGKKWQVIFAVLTDKNWQEMLRLIIPVTTKFYLVKLSHARAESPETIAAFLAQTSSLIDYQICSNATEALTITGAADHRLAIGSLYLIGEVMASHYTEDTLPSIID
jgi:dihydrofolate synthase/folylpolyglutamate synthase